MPRSSTLLLLTILAAASLTACSPPPSVTVAETSLGLGFRRVLADGSALVSGSVRVPANLVQVQGSMFVEDGNGGGPGTLNELPVAQATIETLDLQGKPVPNVLPAHTDVAGRFSVRGLLPGSPAFLRATFKDARGNERVLYTFVKAGDAGSCMAITLASSLVAEQLLKQGSAAGTYDPTKLEQVITMAKQKLPQLLEPVQPAPPGGSSQANQALDQLTSSGGGSAGQTITDQLFNSDPGIKDAMQKAQETSLTVDFTIEEVGTNDADFLKPERIRQSMNGNVQLICRAPAGAISAVTFWLGNEQIVEGTEAKGTWVANFDTRTLSDGAYVLSAIARRTSEDHGQIHTKAFVYINNAAPNGDAGCQDNGL